MTEGTAIIGAVKIPVYNFADPALWFTMCEATFELGTPKAISESRTKYNYIVSHLPAEAASIVRDVIKAPNSTDPYNHIKTELIKRAEKSTHQEIKKLLGGEQLGDRRPSELLRIMRRRAESYSVSDELMLELFLQHLPSFVQSILAAITPLTLDKAAEVADRVIDVSPSPVAVSATNICSANTSDSIEERLLAEIKKLHVRIDNISRDRRRTRSQNKYRG
ncbi:uncharacterized protein LOC118185191 [Stegodyphus dumicola]|uniref:uncharacterized protein LOC118185191 n=1 Tax=Stegodyphus dumicola TaxID=202533 RepID=UPI0015B0CA26|nr:uncharacterized protein LOC118185191 [Stegodyphus dumicola]